MNNKKLRIYLAARYSRRLELCGYRDQLTKMGHNVQARWLDGGHQINDAGVPVGEDGILLVRSNEDDSESSRLRAKFAQDDFEDVMGANLLIAFTEPPRSTNSRGGRHVEFGIALGRGIPVIAIGYRENIFHWLPIVGFFETFEQALPFLPMLEFWQYETK